MSGGQKVFRVTIMFDAEKLCKKRKMAHKVNDTGSTVMCKKQMI